MFPAGSELGNSGHIHCLHGWTDRGSLKKSDLKKWLLLIGSLTCHAMVALIRPRKDLLTRF